MATPIEILARLTELTRRFDSLRVIGTGWSGNSREGFLFDVDAGGGGGGTLFSGGITQTPPIPPPFPPPYPPPIPPGDFGACCCAGACTQSTRRQCTGGCTFYPGGDCFLGNPCGPVAHSGACCFDDTHCEVVPANECTGTYLGDNTTCAGVNCADVGHSGACCCYPNNCSIQPSAGCSGTGCTYLGDGSTCAGVNCGDTYYCPTSCFSSGQCDSFHVPHDNTPRCCPGRYPGQYPRCCYNAGGGFYYTCCCHPTPFGDVCGC